MKIRCKKENDAKKMLQLILKLLESEGMDYPILEEDLVLEITLKSTDNQSCPANQECFCFDLEDIECLEDSADYYYSNDALTRLYNRGKYERDIAILQNKEVYEFACIYIDAVGLHETNNHLGHTAGDLLLCSIADGIREYFPNLPAYRIGGDEFVIFCFNQEEAAIRQAISGLKSRLKQEEYEISVGMEINTNGLAIMDTINRAEHAMRYDKAQFYRQNGKKRQMRSLNYKLEKLLLEKQDASQFLNVIAAEYKGAYIVNPQKDTCRYIYIPEYFKDILEENNGVFSKSIRMYCDKLVCPEDRELFEGIYNFDDVLRQIKQGNQITFTYRKQNGSRVHLQITIYDPNSSDSNEMLWIFMDGDLKPKE